MMCLDLKCSVIIECHKVVINEGLQTEARVATVYASQVKVSSTPSD